MSSRRPGDWDCALCQHHNFGFREACQQCGGPRPCVAAVAAAAGGGRHSLLRGDWFCECGAHNFANRPSCHSCAAAASSALRAVFGGGLDDDDVQGGVDYGGGGWKHGDWLCTRFGCNQHNFASRKECFRCKAPKGCGT